MEDVVGLEMVWNFYLLLGPGLQALTFLKVRVVEAGNNETNPQSISLKGSSQSKASPHMRNLKYKGKYPNYERPNNRNMCLRKREPSYTLLNMDNLTMGNQMFELSYHLLYYFYEFIFACINYTKPSITPFER